MVLDARMILAGAERGIDMIKPVSSFQAGQRHAQQMESEDINQQRSLLDMELAKAQEARAAALAPLQQESAQSQLDAQTRAQNLINLSSAAKIIKPYIESGDALGATTALTQFKGVLPDDVIDEVAGLIDSGDLTTIGDYISNLEELSSSGAESELIKSSQRLVNIDGQQFSEVDVFQDGKLKSIRTPVSGEVARKTTGETVKEQREAEVRQAGEEVLAKGRAEVKTPLGKIKLDEALAKSESERQAIVDRKKSRRSEALNAISLTNDLLDDDFFSNAYGRIVADTPERFRTQDAIDAQAKIDQIIGLLSLESREKLKGQGTITDSEAKTLEKSATLLANPRISEDVARREIQRVRGIFEDAAARNKLNKLEQPEKPETKDYDLEYDPATGTFR